jgi:hypothetical protein
MPFFARIMFIAGMLYYVDTTFYGGIHIDAVTVVSRHVANAILTALLQFT